MYFFTKNPNLKKNQKNQTFSFFFFFLEGGRGKVHGGNGRGLE